MIQICSKEIDEFKEKDTNFKDQLSKAQGQLAEMSV